MLRAWCELDIGSCTQMLLRGISLYRKAYGESAIVWKQKVAEPPMPIDIVKRSFLGICDFPRAIAVEVWVKLRAVAGYCEHRLLHRDACKHVKGTLSTHS